MKKARTIRVPGLTIDVGGASVMSESRLSAMSAQVSDGRETLQGSVRGAKPEGDDGSSTRRLIIDQPRYQKPPRQK